MYDLRGKASSPTITNGMLGCVVPSNGQGAGRDMEPVSSDLPNSELEKTPPSL